MCYMKGLSWFRENMLDGLYFGVLGSLPCAALGRRLQGAAGLVFGMVGLGVMVTLVIKRDVMYLLAPVHIATCAAIFAGFANAMIKPSSFIERLVAGMALGYLGGMAITWYSHHHLGLTGYDVPPLEAYHGIPYIFAALALSPPAHLWNHKQMGLEVLAPTR